MDLLKQMDMAAREDRERFFKVADTIHLQPKYAEYLEDLDIITQLWRDMTKFENYPQINFPLVLPDWFPKVDFKSRWDQDFYQKTIQNK